MSDIKISQLTAATALHPDAIVPVIQTDPNDGVVKNFTARASQFATGVQLLGKLIGADMNFANSATISYTGHTGFAFQPGDTLKDNNTGATAVITADSGTTLTVSSLDLSSGAFTPAGTISGSIGQISYGSLTGAFQTTEEIIGQTSGAKAFISTDGSGTMTISNVSGTFVTGETITGGTSGATAVIATYTAPASASVILYTFVSGDQPITLSGGTAFIVTDIVITNASIALNSISVGFFYTMQNLSGYLIGSTPSGFSALISSANFINNTSGVNVSPPAAEIGTTPIAPILSNNTIFFSLNAAQGVSATVDIYVYGYTIY